jgi:hypothetical protein
MTNSGVSCCEALSEALVEKALIFIDKFREWGVPIPDGGSAFLEIKFCPFCGVVLPASLRHAWFDKADELGVGPPYDAHGIPTSFTRCHPSTQEASNGRVKVRRNA